MLELLLTYKYLIIFPLGIIEGPILTVVAGFLVTLHVLNPLFVYIIVVLADVVGDSIAYCFGYLGKRFLPYLKITDEKLEKAKIYFNENHKKAIIASKVVYGFGTTGLIAAGVLRIPYKKFFITCISISMVQSFVLLMIGILFGQAYEVIGKYFDYYAAVASTIALAVILFILIRKYKINIKS